MPTAFKFRSLGSFSPYELLRAQPRGVTKKQDLLNTFPSNLPLIDSLQFSSNPLTKEKIAYSD